MTSTRLARVRSYLAFQHLHTAQLFAAQSAEAERSNQKTDWSPNDLTAFVTGAIFATAAYLEASINELLADAADSSNGVLQQIDPAAAKRTSRLWTRGIARTAKYATLEKYDVALLMFDRPVFDRGAAPFQNANLVIELRNALIHYEPEWIMVRTPDGAKRRTHRFEERLQGKFAPNRRASERGPFFPHRCLGAGCAAWAVSASRAYVAEFWHLLGIPAPQVRYGIQHWQAIDDPAV